MNSEIKRVHKTASFCQYRWLYCDVLFWLFSAHAVPELADLVSELQEVIDWIALGLYLGIKMERLEAIRADFLTLEQCRTQMLNEWQKNVTPTWSAVVQALLGMGMRRLASELAQKHG